MTTVIWGSTFYLANLIAAYIGRKLAFFVPFLVEEVYSACQLLSLDLQEVFQTMEADQWQHFISSRYKLQSRAHHPDKKGDPETWQRYQEANGKIQAWLGWYLEEWKAVQGKFPSLARHKEKSKERSVPGK